MSITIEFSKKETEELLKNEEELISKVKEEEGYFFFQGKILKKVRKGETTLDDIMGGTLSENFTPTKNIQRQISKLLKKSGSQNFEEKYYKVIQEELIRKLGEYGYFHTHYFQILEII